MQKNAEKPSSPSKNTQQLPSLGKPEFLVTLFSARRNTPQGRIRAATHPRAATYGCFPRSIGILWGMAHRDSRPGRHPLALPAGFRLDNYLIQDVLGEGGFGITYLAEDVHSGRQVAIKELLPRSMAARVANFAVVSASDQHEEPFQWALERFTQEARALARLRHPNIVPIHRLIPANGTAYMVMDYLEGQSMGQWLKSQAQLTEPQIRAILMPLLDGLEHVHNNGLLHRDIKPDNILITADGKPVLLDFGSARVTAGRTETLTSIVSEGYSPYEQYQRKSRQTAATDLYALAAVMVRAITGEAPPTAIDRAVRSTTEIPLATSHSGRYSASLLRSIDQAFAMEAGRRLQSVAQWRASLQAASSPPAAASTVISTSARIPSPHTNHPPAVSRWLVTTFLSVTIAVSTFLLLRFVAFDKKEPHEPAETIAAAPNSTLAEPPKPAASQPIPATPQESPSLQPIPAAGPAGPAIPRFEALPSPSPPQIPSPSPVAPVSAPAATPQPPSLDPSSVAPVPLTPRQKKIATLPSLAKVKFIDTANGFVIVDAGNNRKFSVGMRFAIRRGSFLIARMKLTVVESDESAADVAVLHPGATIEVGDEVIQDVPPDS